jgi:tripartite ATP-independent transporter DctM subunit
MFTGIDIFTFLAIPLFILAGQIMNASEISKRILTFSNNLVGHITGSLSLVNVLASMLFAGLTGSAVSDAAGLGSIEIPMMLKGGYDLDFSAAITAASAVLGPIIPPSVVMILYAIIAGNVSVSDMFLAGYIPGILLGLSLMVVCYFISKKKKYPKKEHRAGLKEMIISFYQTLPALFMPIIILGGILSGVFTATESAAIAVLYAIIVAIFFLKTLKFRDLPSIFLETAKTTSSVLFIVAVSTVLAWILTVMQLPQRMAAYFLSYANTTFLFLLFSNILLLITGCLLDLTAGLIIMVPILSPVATLLGINPLHFGMVVVLNLCIGLITPPVGMVLFVTSNVAKISLGRIFKAIMPFVVVEILVLFLITYVPVLTTFVPKLFH